MFPRLLGRRTIPERAAITASPAKSPPTQAARFQGSAAIRQSFRSGTHCAQQYFPVVRESSSYAPAAQAAKDSEQDFPTCLSCGARRRLRQLRQNSGCVVPPTVHVESPLPSENPPRRIPDIQSRSRSSSPGSSAARRRYATAPLKSFAERLQPASAPGSRPILPESVSAAQQRYRQSAPSPVHSCARLLGSSIASRLRSRQTQDCQLEPAASVANFVYTEIP